MTKLRRVVIAAKNSAAAPADEANAVLKTAAAIDLPDSSFEDGGTGMGAVLESDRQHFLDQLPSSERETYQQAEVVRRIGMLLMMTPYGASQAVILQRLNADPLISARYPQLTFDDLEIVRRQNPDIVPNPNRPVPLSEQSMDMFVGCFFLAFQDRYKRAQQKLPDLFPENLAEYSAKRYGPFSDPLTTSDRFRHLVNGDRRIPVTEEFDRPFLAKIAGATERVRGKMGAEGVMLRRIVMAAPAHWSYKEIAEEYNRHLSFYSSVWFSSKDSDEQFSEIDARKVERLMTEHPYEIGTNSYRQRREQLRSTLAEVFSIATPQSNLFELLETVSEKLIRAASPLSEDEKPWIAWPSTQELFHFIAADPTLRSLLDVTLATRRDQVDLAMAQQLAHTLAGTSLTNLSVREISNIMRPINAEFIEGYVSLLLENFPEIFRLETPKLGSVEPHLLIAVQLANLMDRMKFAATLEDVVAFAKEENRGLKTKYPNFQVEDLKLLQKAYPFMPQWNSKTPDDFASPINAEPLNVLLADISDQLGPSRAKPLLREVFDALAQPDATGKLNDGLRLSVQKAYAEALQELAKEFIGPVPRSSRGVNDFENSIIDQINALLSRPVGTREQDVGALLSLLKQERPFDLSLIDRRPENLAAVATCLIAARETDFDGLLAAITELNLKGSEETVFRLRVKNLKLGCTWLPTQIEHDVLQNEALRESMRRFSRIPLRLPLTQTVADKYREQQPFAHHNIFMVQHGLGQAYPQVDTFIQLGAEPEKMSAVWIPYHNNVELDEAVNRSFGINARFPPQGDIQALNRYIEEGIDKLVANHRKNSEPMLIVCDGPHAREYFKKTYPEFLSQARFTEQTAFGDRPEYREDKSVTCVSYARTMLKRKKEAKYIGQAIARAIDNVLIKMGTGAEEKPVLILGNGPVGEATAEAFAGRRSKVFLYDPNMTPEQQLFAEGKGYTVIKDRALLTPGKFLMVGCSGYLSIDEQEILNSDPNAIFASGSSKLAEINMKALADAAQVDPGVVRKVVAAIVNNQITWHYWLADGTIRTVVADGLPVNFNDINSVPPEDIDMTMAMGLASAVQATTCGETGFLDLNAEDHDMLVSGYQAIVDERLGDTTNAPDIEPVDSAESKLPKERHSKRVFPQSVFDDLHSQIPEGGVDVLNLLNTDQLSESAAARLAEIQGSYNQQVTQTRTFRMSEDLRGVDPKAGYTGKRVFRAHDAQGRFCGRYLFKILDREAARKVEALTLLSNVMGIKTPIATYFELPATDASQKAEIGVMLKWDKDVTMAMNFDPQKASSETLVYLLVSRWFSELIGNLDVWKGQFLVPKDPALSHQSIFHIDPDNAFLHRSAEWVQRVLIEHFGLDPSNVPLSACSWTDRPFRFEQPVGWAPEFYDSMATMYGPVFRDYVAGKIDIDLDEVRRQIAATAEFPSDAVLNAMSGYLEAEWQKHNGYILLPSLGTMTRPEFERQFIERWKNSIKDFSAFLGQLQHARNHEGDPIHIHYSRAEPWAY